VTFVIKLNINIYLDVKKLATALEASLMACLANSPAKYIIIPPKEKNLCIQSKHLKHHTTNGNFFLQRRAI
jgi:hypothetical protein